MDFFTNILLNYSLKSFSFFFDDLLKSMGARVFVQQEISQAADAAVRKYNDATPDDDRKPEEAARAMRVGTKERTKTLMVKMGKLLAVAHPANGPGFLKEVTSLPTSLHYKCTRLLF
jgi:hypothetical protein